MEVRFCNYVRRESERKKERERGGETAEAAEAVSERNVHRPESG